MRTKKPLKEVLPIAEDTVINIPIAKLSIDYPSEGLNNMARKINEIIDRLS